MTDLVRPSGASDRMPNCGVTAVAVIAGAPFQEVWDHIARKFLKRPGAWKGRTYITWLRRVLMDEYRIALHSEPLGSRQAGKRLTLRRWVEEEADPAKTYLVSTTGHFQVVHGQKVVDQYTPRGVDVRLFRGNRKTVKAAYRVQKLQ